MGGIIGYLAILTPDIMVIIEVLCCGGLEVEWGRGDC